MKMEEAQKQLSHFSTLDGATIETHKKIFYANKLTKGLSKEKKELLKAGFFKVRPCLSSAIATTAQALKLLPEDLMFFDF